VDIDATTIEHGLGGDPAAQEHRGGWRLVGGQAFLRDGADGAYRPQPAPKGDDGGGPAAQFHDQLEAADALATLARTAPDVTSAPAGGGATRFTTTIAATDVPAIFGPRWDALGDRARLDATVGDDGIVHTIALGAPNKSVTITFDALGQPQGITAP
jgi:hypothetical protein